MYDDVKNYLRLNDDCDREQVESLISAAKVSLSAAGVSEDEDNELYRLVVKVIVSEFYDNRSADLNKIFTSNLVVALIAQLRN
jgi:uncharacterized phage protein (predicted DNA packaging)